MYHIFTNAQASQFQTPQKSPDFNESRILSPPLRMLAKLNVTN